MSLYDVLRIPKNGTKDDVEHAYRLLARQYFRNQEAIDQTGFAEINKAYTILKDEHKRSFYNMFGDLSIQLLLQSKDSYIITRIFDRFNVLMYFFASIMIEIALFVLPFLVAHEISVSVYMSIPLGIATVAIIVSAIRSIASLSKVYGFGNELKNVVCRSITFVLVIAVYFNYMLYADGAVKSLAIPICIFVGLQGLVVLNSILSWKLSGQTEDFNKKKILIDRIWKLVMFATLVTHVVPSFIKPLLFLEGIWNHINRKYSVFVNACVTLPSIFYISTFSLILAGFKSAVIYIPLGIFMTLIIGTNGFIIATIVNINPKSKYNSNISGSLPYYEV
ncbi:hypothetical protein OCOL_001365 [Ordospora colligata]|uniref:J domain-containing protein n=1 Tax=Ordospora colligata OC4 TaxID=1354746 RepID=A0A0B2UMP0_9MICR|nr:uncharacterized protein M896_020610 [Ordospora colligata OC4]KHN70225.1 hypothetical protein M896_020610 [Ordospora colligata OC4]TBU16769.1 hypothetical protein CWI41_020620 [Ordospora colligata]